MAANYGTSIVYDFPKTRLVDGPLQIEARIDQNAQLSGQLTLWNQQGSHVRRGTLLVIPSGRALLYAGANLSASPAKPHARAAHRRACAAGPPRLRSYLRLCAGLRCTTERLVITAPRPNRSYRGSRQHRKPSPAITRECCKARSSATGDNAALIAQASRDFDDYQRLTAQGKLTEAGQKLDDLKRTLDQLNARQPKH